MAQRIIEGEVFGVSTLQRDQEKEKMVRELVNSRQSPGNYTITWDGKNNHGKEVASGIYFYQLATGDYKETMRLVLIK